jgi:hypothetical protein
MERDDLTKVKRTKATTTQGRSRASRTTHKTRTTASTTAATTTRTTAAPATDPRFQPVISSFARVRGVEVEPGWGRGNLVLKVNAKIFALLSGAGFVAKLPKARVDELVAQGAGQRFDPRKNGRVMKEWLVAGPGCDWIALAREAHRFVKAGDA